MRWLSEGPFHCHVCKVGALIENARFVSLPGVTSDARPWSSGARIGLCGNCNMTVKRVDDAWNDAVKGIYETYSAYHQSNGAEKISFDQSRGPAEPRSAALIRRLTSAVELPAGARTLDIGTGSGVMLRALSQLRPDLQLWAQDISGHNRAGLEAIPGFAGLHVGDVSSIKERYDLVTMVQVLEHVTDPYAFLISLRSIIKEGGALLINIPDARANPFDILIVDHCSHFTLEHLKALTASAGYDVVLATNDLLPRELVVVARPVREPAGAAWPSSRIDVDADVRWLEGIRDKVQALRLSGPTAIFGASNAGVWLCGATPDWDGVFVDEDRNRIGNTLFGHRILAPSEVPSGTTVFVPLAEELANNIARRLATDAVRYVVPTPMRTPAAQGTRA
jgi:2-polyprenyl-3-methyl-5-hydroxy-6-metoxy-1,4-benzoquinol methylase